MSEHKTTLSKSKALTGASTLFFTQLIGFGVYFLSQRIVLSTITKEENGSLFLVQFFASTAFSFLVDMGLSNIALRELVKHPERREQIISSVFWIRFIGSVIATIVVIFLAAYRIPDSFLLSLSIALYINLSGRFFMMRNTFELRYREVFQFRTLSLLVFSEFTIYFLLLQFYKHNLTPTIIAVILLISVLPGTFYLLFSKRHYTLFISAFNITEILLLFRELRPIYILMLLQQVHVFVDTWVLQHYANSLSEVGIFGAVGNMLLISSVFITSVSSVLIPIITNSLTKGKEVTKKMILISLNVVQSAVLLLAVLGAVFSPFIIQIISNNRYADNVLEFRLQFLSSCFIMFAQLGLQVSTSLNERKAIMYSGIGLVIGSLSADFILIPMFLTKGIILSKVWSNLLSVVVFMWYMRSWISTKQTVSYMVRYLTVILINIFGINFILQQFEMLKAGVIGLLFTITTLVLFGLLSKNELTLFKGTLRKVTS